MSIDEWFKHIREKCADQMQCGKGCTACCYGLFDISLKDAAGVARGFRELPPDRARAIEGNGYPSRFCCTFGGCRGAHDVWRR